MINVQIERGANENSTGVLRKFTKRVQEAGILNRVRGIRYHERSPSDYTRKKMALKRIGKKAVLEKAIKDGKVRPSTR